MFKISPINDKSLQEKYAALCDSEFHPDYFAYVMTDVDTGDVMGFSQFEIEANGGYISDLRPKHGLEDFEAMFILGRSTMNFIDLCGKSYCRANKNAADARLLRAIGFRENESGELDVDMTGMFDGKCSCESH